MQILDANIFLSSASAFSLTDDANRLKGQVQNTGIYLSEQGKRHAAD